MTKSGKGLLLLTSVGLRPVTTLPKDQARTGDGVCALVECIQSYLVLAVE